MPRPSSNTNNMIIQKELANIMRLPGKVRGVVFKTDAEYIRSKEGEEGLRNVQEKLKEWGCPIPYLEGKNTEWYPIGLRALSILAAKEVFGWGDEVIFDMGHAAPQYSFMVKFLMRYFLTLRKTYEKSPEYWPTHYTIGKLEAPDYNEKEKYFVLRLRDFTLHHALCPYYAGYFLRIAEFASTYSNMRVEERACSHKKSSAHEFVVRWN